MDKIQIEQISKERLDRWVNFLVSEHATPVVLVGVGHDHKSGTVVLCAPESMTDIEIDNFLTGALLRLRQKQAEAR